MPELPEVETVRRGLAAHLPGRVLRQVELRREDLRWPIPGAALAALVGRRVTAVERRAKYLLLRLHDRTVLVHLGMSGKLLLEPVRRQPPAWQRHEHWRMRFAAWLLRYVDARRFGVLDVVPAGAPHRLLGDLGPEPLEPDFDPAWVHARTRGRRIAVKVWLMDARAVAGVGNIYASESCFRAGVKPGRLARTLTRAECARLVAAVRAVLGAAIAAGGTTLRDYAGVDARAGEFEQELAVYGRAGEPCRRCGASIRRAVHGGRATYWCPSCQE